MTREEIEQALITSGSVSLEAGSGERIKLAGPSAQRLAQLIFSHIRTSEVDELKADTAFFEKLEVTFQSDLNKFVLDREYIQNTDEEPSSSDQKSWRLKKVETKGFGGLNSTADDVFEFDLAGWDFCIEGQNGSGKSSLANAVLFALTGKIHRDQHGLLDDPARTEPVVSNEGSMLADWPPIAVYPDRWSSGPPLVDVSVKLTFKNGIDDEEIVVRRGLRGQVGTLKEDVSEDQRLLAVPALIEAGLLMPMRIQHIRVPEADDNEQLVGLIRQLIGLEPLLKSAELVDKLVNRQQRFLKYAKDNDAEGKAAQVSRLLKEAQEKIQNLGTELDLTITIETNKRIADKRLEELGRAKEELDKQQAEGFRNLSSLAFKEFDSDSAEDRTLIANAVDRLSLDASRQRDAENLPAVLQAITSISQKKKQTGFKSLKVALQKASDDLEASIEWAEKQEHDALLRLKAVAAAHFEDYDDPLCPLCRQPINGVSHRRLLEDLRILKAHAEEAQTKLADACRRIETEVKRVAQGVVPDIFMNVGRFAVKRDIQNQVRAIFVEAKEVADVLPGFAALAQSSIDTAFQAVEEFEFGAKLPEPADADDARRVRRLLDHLNDTLNAAENWESSRDVFRDAWGRLLVPTEADSLAGRVLELKAVIEGVEPFRSASGMVAQALEVANSYNTIATRQTLRENIADALRPLRRLRQLVNLTTRQTIRDVSASAKQIHKKIYNPETLTYQNAEISEHRSKQSLVFRGGLGADPDWLVDASVLANTSWMRGILWSFVFAIRERAIERSGYCPFELVLLDDPQITFDTRNMRGWVRFLGGKSGLKANQPCQLLVTTHSMPFALDMMPVLAIQKAEIETGRPWSRPSQIVHGDFAAVRYERMLKEQSDDLARGLIADIRTLAETLLKHSIERFDPVLVREPEATLGRIVYQIAQSSASGQTPYNDSVFGDLISAKSSNPELFRQLSEPHHSVSEMITVGEAKLIYPFWKDTLFPVLRRIWEHYRFLQKSIVGEVASIQLPANCNHRPPRLTTLANIKPLILGRVSAASDGRVASASQIADVNDGSEINFSQRAAYRVEKDTLSPVARIGDIVLTRLDSKCRPSNLVVEDRGTHLLARRWLVDPSATDLAVLVAASSNPRRVPPAVISRSRGANRRKVVGVLFASGSLQPGVAVDSNTEVTALEANDQTVASLVADTEAFEVRGSSAEPLALDKQFILAKPPNEDLVTAVLGLEGKPVIAESEQGYVFFKRLWGIDSNYVVLESLDKSGVEGVTRFSIGQEGPSPSLVRVREVVGIVFDKE